MSEVDSKRVKVGGTGRAILLDVSLFDGVSLEWVPGAGGASSAELEAKLSYAGVSGQGVAFGTAATLSESTRRRVGLDVANAPWLEIEVTTAGATDEVGTLHVYGYTTT
jgi:hypothetical protein